MATSAARNGWAVIAPALGAAATAQYLYTSRSPLVMEEHRSKLPIYSSPAEPVTLAEVRGPLEDQVASARTFLSDATKSGRDTIRGQVDRWIGVEKAVETKVSSLIADTEPITPGILYVGVATLAGSVFTRYRSLPVRFLTPPLFLIGSLNYFLPKTTHNMSQYYLEVESAHLPPVVKDQRENFLRLWHKSTGAAKQTLEKAREGTGELLHKGLQGVEDNTGLKVGSGQHATITVDGKKMV
ncbi:hypothetical protein CBS101457_005437 [Exobasidium rhododendri]|nr:hypothetical protein CBS101457_005437 [Exobasidium rhododendri]